LTTSTPACDSRAMGSHQHEGGRAAAARHAPTWHGASGDAGPRFGGKVGAAGVALTQRGW
jgi:hypothetical protein